MALTYIYAVSPATQFPVTLTPNGSVKSLTPNSQGIITGVSAADAQFINQTGAGRLELLCATGATTDRPTPSSYAAAGINIGSEVMPTFAMRFYDTTLSKMVFFVGPQSSTGWVDPTTGAAA